MVPVMGRGFVHHGSALKPPERVTATENLVGKAKGRIKPPRNAVEGLGLRV